MEEVASKILNLQATLRSVLYTPTPCSLHQLICKSAQMADRRGEEAWFDAAIDKQCQKVPNDKSSIPARLVFYHIKEKLPPSCLANHIGGRRRSCPVGRDGQHSLHTATSPPTFQ